MQADLALSAAGCALHDQHVVADVGDVLVLLRLDRLDDYLKVSVVTAGAAERLGQDILPSRRGSRKLTPEYLVYIQQFPSRILRCRFRSTLVAMYPLGAVYPSSWLCVYQSRPTGAVQLNTPLPGMNAVPR